MCLSRDDVQRLIGQTSWGRGTSELIPYQKHGIYRTNIDVRFETKIYYFLDACKVRTMSVMKVYNIKIIMYLHFCSNSCLKNRNLK